MLLMNGWSRNTAMRIILTVYHCLLKATRYPAHHVILECLCQLRACVHSVRMESSLMVQGSVSSAHFTQWLGKRSASGSFTLYQIDFQLAASKPVEVSTVMKPISTCISVLSSLWWMVKLYFCLINHDYDLSQLMIYREMGNFKASFRY